MAPSVEDHAADPDQFDLRVIQDELSSIWNTGQQEGDSRDRVRACAVNFVIPIEPDTYTGWQDSLDELARLVPSRILLVERTQDGTRPAIDACVRATCHKRKDGALMCSELVHIRCVPDALPRVPSICRALAVSDLPLLLVSLVDAKLGGQAARALFEMSDLVVLDSSAREDFTDEVFCDGDLMWPRLSAWRTAIASFLAGSEGFRPDQVERIEIVGRRAAPQLLAGWLAFLLHGRLIRTADEAPRIELPGGRTLVIAITGGEGRVCGIDSVKLQLVEGMAVTFGTADSGALSIDALLGAQPIQSHYPVRRYTFAEEVAHIVHSHGADEVYGHSRLLALAIPPPGPRF